MKRLSRTQVVRLHEILVKHSGGALGLRDDDLLESAVNMPFSSFGGVDLCPTIQSKAAKLCFGLVKNHAFVDGNKRIGILAMLSFLEINGIALSCTDDALVALGLGLAAGELTEQQVLEFIISHS